MMITTPKSREPEEHIWIVEGSCGAYSDRITWIVCAYKTEEEAAYHREKAQARSDELYRKYDNRYFDMPSEENEWDKNESYDYTGTRYIYYMIEVKYLELSK